MAVELLRVSELRKRTLKLVRHLQRVPERFIVTRDGRPAAVLMSYEEFRSLIATLETVLDPEMTEGIREGLKDLKTKRLRSFEEVFGEPL